MSKILKNNTVSDIELNSIGVTIPASGQVTIAEEDYLLLASSDSVSEITTLINAGDVTVNDGIGDLFPEKGINFIKYQDNFIREKTVFISPSGSNTTGDGSKNNPYQNLTGVKDAIVAGDITTPNSSNPLFIKCDSGIYTQAPVDFSSYSSVLIEGRSARSIFVATNPNADLITMGTSSTVKHILLQGVTNASNYLLKFTATGSGIASVFDVFFNSTSSNGVTATNTTGEFRVIIANCFASLLTGAYVTCNSNIVMIVTALGGIGDGTNSIGYVQNGSGELYLYTSNVDNFATDVQINGDTGIVQLNNLSSLNTNNILDQNGNSKLEVLGGNFDATTASLTNTSVIEGYFFNELVEENQFRVLSEMSVGLPNNGKETVLGEGDAYVSGLLVYTYNGTSYTSVSATAASPSGSSFTFPSTSVNDAIYISSAFSLTNPLKFYGIKAIIDNAAVLGSGDIIFEYWNGSSWVEFNHMMRQSNSPYLSYANSKLEETGQYQINFDSRIETSWTTNDPVSLGVNLYWVRLRIDGASITTSPTIQQIKIHTNRFEVEANGFHTMYGLGRVKKKFPISIGGLQSNAGRSPNSSDVYLSDNLGISGDENTFPSNQNRSKIFSHFMTFDFDTSCPAELTIAYFGNSATAGVVQWNVIWSTSDVLEGVYSSTNAAPTTSANERTTTVTDSIPASGNNKNRYFSIKLEVPEAFTQQTDGNPRSKLWIRLTRNVSGADTYGGDVILTEFSVFYTSSRGGGYIGDFT